MVSLLTLVVRDSADHEVTDSMVVNVDVTRNIHQPSLRVFYQQEIPETQGVGTQVANLTGSDLDGDELRYEITGTNQTRQYFYVIPTEGGIYLKKPLQGPEHPRLFYFNVKVRDQRNPEKSSTASFTIRVSSENVPPQWLQLPYGTNIKRNASVGDVVITVAAADPDLKGTLRYRLGPGVVPAPYFFTIDEITGQVKVRNSLTFGTDSVYNLRVQAFDDGYPFNYNETTVTLTIPQQAPVWQTTVITRNISRSLGPGSTVITLDGYVTDPDGDSLTYTPEDGSTPGAYSYFLLRQDNGKIIVTGLLSQAPSSTYRFNIRATDNRRPQQSASGVVIINLMDEEKPPVQNISYTTTIDDTHPVNSDVFELRNSGNVILRYEMAEEQQQYPASYFFRVTQDGHVQVKQSLLNDVQLSPKYTLLVAGYNTAEPGSGPLVYITLYVNVRRNQAGPQFNRTVYYSNITDTHPIGGLVIILQGRDPDGGSITYNLVGDENAKAHFFVHPTTGEIILIKSLADVTTSYFYLVIEACDDDRPKKCVNLTSTINVLRNRNLPQFTNVPHTLSNFPPGVNSGYIVYRVQAIYPQGGDLEYQLVGEGPATQYFRINQTTGEIIVRRPLDRDISMYILKVLARVIDQPQLSTTGTVTLFVNTNTKAPQFNPSVIMVPIDPDQQVNTPFRTVTATDEDGDELTYSLIMVIPEYSSQWFRIDPNTGAISLTNSVEYDNSTRYTLVVQAADGGYPSPQFGYATVHVLVDRIGGISVSSFTANISESHPVGGFVKVITATGSGLRGSPRFRITGVYPAPHFFSIVEDTGVIRVHRSLREDSLQLPAFIVRVEVYDSLYPENKASATGVINVMRNPTGPRFTPPTYNVNLTDISPGGMLIQVYATDEDGDDLRYTIESANDDGLNLFHITPDDGVIYMRKPVSEAQKDEYTGSPRFHITGVYPAPHFFSIVEDTGVIRVHRSLREDSLQLPAFIVRVEVYDSLYPENKASATGVINVMRNPTGPRFTPPTYNVNLTDISPGGMLIQVYATDEDGDDLRYTIESANDDGLNLFHITPDDGVIYMRKPVSEAQKDEYTLVVMAKDGRGKNATALVYINVVGDSLPFFENLPETIDIPDTRAVKSTIFTALGRDNTLSGNLVYTVVGNFPAELYFEVGNNSRGEGEVKIRRDLRSDNYGTRVYTVELTVHDSAVPGRKGRGELIVRVNRLSNPNPPRFERNSYNYTISDTYSVGLSLPPPRIRATDPENDTVSYSIVETADGNSVSEYFFVNPNTADIKVIKNLTTASDVYTFIIEAADSGIPVAKSQAYVTVNIERRANRAPVFLPPYAANVSQNFHLSDSFFRVLVSDRSVAPINLDIVGEAPAPDLFRVNSDTGKLYIKSLDLASQVNLVYYLDIEAYYTDSPEYKTRQLYTVNVNRNPHKPYFPSQLNIVQLKENHQLGVPITINGQDRLVAKDLDGDNLYFEFVGNSDFFFINPRTGQISLKKTLLGTTQNNHVLNVSVTDDGQPPESAEVEVQVEVVRGLQPYFEQQFYNVTIDDTAEDGTVVLPSLVSRSNSVQDRIIIWPVGTPRAMFYFNFNETRYENTGGDAHYLEGNIYLQASVARDTRPNPYQLILVTYDQAYTDTKNTATVQINVNRNSGNVYFNPSLYPVEVEDTTPIGAALVQVKATDEDGDPITYSILSGGQFFIHPTTGWIYTTGQLSDSDYYLNVQASDRGNPEKTDNATVHIHVVFDTDLPVVTLPPGVDVEVTWPRNRGIINVTATDANLRGELVYELVGDHTSMQFFGINNETGQIYLKRSLLEDPALNTQYFLTVRVYDTAFPENSREALTIFRVNRNPGYPIFIGDYDKTIAEDYGWGVVVNVTAVDAERQKMEYELIGNQRAMQYFYINKDTGAVHIKRPLPAGRNETFYLTVRATDNGKPPNSEETTFTIQVVGTSTGLPVFENTPYIVNVSENRPTDSLVFDQVLARLPSGSQGRVQYELAEYGQFFRIQKDTGFIYLTNSLRDGNLDVYRQRIAAYSSLRPDVKAYTDVVFYVSRNENPPVPEYNYIVVNITDYHQLGARIVTLTAIDRDNDHLRYKLTSSGDCLQYFYMDSDTGMMSLRSTLEESSPRTFDCLVTISDRGVGDNPNTAEVNIRVNVIKDVTPEVANVTLEIPEDMGVGTVIATIQGRKDNVVGHLKYETDGIYPAPTFFSINETSGQIQIARSLRKDTLRLTSYTLVVRVFDTSSPSSVGVANVYITVTRNPGQVTVFPTSHRLTIQDTQLVGEDLFILNGTDPSGDKLYWNISGSELAREYFWVNPDTGAISVKKDLTLDTSGTENYVVLVCAYDPYGSTACSNIVVHVNRDKNVPEFPGQQNNFTVPDSTNETTVITIVRARDDDCPDSAQILYNLVGEFPAPSFFEIEPTTGEISLKTDLKLDVSNTNPYVLRVEAYCSAFPENKAVKEFYVYVDRNRYGPEVLNGPFSTDLQEFQPPGYVIFTVMGSDRDGDQLTYRIVGNNDVKHWFYIQPDTGELQLKSPLSETNITDFNFHINITDRGSPEKFILTPVSIKVIRDTGPPKFNGPYSAAVNETVNIDTFVINVAAEDNDLKGRLIYDINGISPAPQRFVINQNGDIRVKDRLDRDNNEQYRIVVIAYDEKYPSNVGSATVTVTVNRNVYRPEFTRTDYSATVDEHAHVGHLVTNVTATDGDSDGTLYYNIIGNENAPEYFFIHPTSGQILISKVLWKDATQATSYTVVVEAKDRGTPQRSSTAVVLVSVTRNQYAPTFERVANLTIPSHQEVATKIYTIVARDPDPQGPNSVIRYSVVGQHNDTFQIGPDSGVLSLRRSIVRDTRELYIVTVRATDGGRPVPKYRDVNIWIRVVQNTTVPRFTQSEYRANVSELAPLNQFVVQVEVIRNGLALLGELRHDLIGSGAEHFRINRDTGAIYLATNLKQITDVNTFSLTVDAYDTRNAEYGRSSVPVYIRVLRVAEPIRFLYSAFAINITETQERIVPIQRVTATDPKGGQLTYSIDTEASTRTSPQPITHWFYIHPTEGDLSVASYLTGDPEKRTEYKLVIKATDRSIPPRSASTIVNIYVSRNMHAPVFSRSTYTANVSESDRINTEIVTVRATDLDGDAVRYKMAVSNEVTSYFTLDEVSGTISIFRNLQTIPGDLLEFQVIATDRRNPEKTSTATVIVYVSRPSVLPVFSTESYNATISEYVRVQTPVQTVKADGRNSIRYTLQGRGSTTGAARYFIISPNTGVVTVAQSLYTDLTQTKLYQMEITATDTVGAIPYTATAYLDVIVLRNEHGPKFSPDRYLQNVSEEIPYGTNLVTVSATDEDSILQPGYPSSKITYSISSQDQLGNRFFQIHPDSGVVSIRQLLVNDIDRRTQYTFTVIAKDGATVPKSSTALVVINVARQDQPDTGEKVLGFEKNLYYIGTKENVAKNRKLLHLTVRYSLLNAAVQCNIAPRDIGNVFEIRRNFKDCELWQIGDLDREAVDFYNLTITVENVNPENSRKKRAVVYHTYQPATVLVHVFDANDNAPQFVYRQPPYLKSIRDPTESVYYGVISSAALPFSPVVQIWATDADLGPNANVTYGIPPANGAPLPFTISSRDGQIYTTKHFVYTEERNKTTAEPFKLEVFAEDNPTDITETPNRSVNVAWINLILDRHRMIMRIAKQKPVQVAAYKAAIIDILQQKSGYVILIEKIENANLQVQTIRNNVEIRSSDEDTDLWFVAVDPTTKKIVERAQLDIESKIMNKAAVAGIASAVKAGPGVRVDDIRAPYTGETKGPTAAESKFVYMNDGDIWWPYLVIALLILILAIVGIILLCWFWSRYKRYMNRESHLYVPGGTMYGAEFVEPPAYMTHPDEETQSLGMYVVNADDGDEVQGAAVNFHDSDVEDETKSVTMNVGDHIQEDETKSLTMFVPTDEADQGLGEVNLTFQADDLAQAYATGGAHTEAMQVTHTADGGVAAAINPTYEGNQAHTTETREERYVTSYQESRTEL
ncbi:protocadherin Fat 4-like [Lingula anatina]|uniref:Protocadherin Fat 4-like n=1 Tax=Lingula anatina TaxID=7574 RepID=A0A1S3JNF8_LINAN|nr:protocadherin Fat 4-like [Lingula anatina]|eukprot:XP_013411494.1 protocadherin Fat 4-like [Lingula anatina]